MRTFCRRSLGGLAGEILLDDYSRRFNIKDLDMLDKTQQHQFVDAFLDGVFSKHLPRARIDSIRLQLNMHFSIEEAAEKISLMLGKKIELEPLDLRYQSYENTKKILENLEDGVISIPISFSGCMQGSVLICIFRDSAIQLGNLMLRSMMKVTKSDDYLDEMKQSAIKEFFNIVIPAFANKVADILGQSLTLSLPETDITDTRAQIDAVNSMLDHNELKKIISTPFDMKIEAGKSVAGMAFLLITSELEIINDSLDGAQIITDDSIEKIDLSSIAIRTELGTYKAMTDFLSNFLDTDPEKAVDSIMDSLGITSLDKVSVGLRRQFIEHMIGTYFSNNTPRIRQFITEGCEKIFSIEKKHVSYKHDNESTSDTISRLIRH